MSAVNLWSTVPLHLLFNFAQIFVRLYFFKPSIQQIVVFFTFCYTVHAFDQDPSDDEMSQFIDKAETILKNVDNILDSMTEVSETDYGADESEKFYIHLACYNH